MIGKKLPSLAMSPMCRYFSAVGSSIIPRMNMEIIAVFFKEVSESDR